MFPMYSALCKCASELVVSPVLAHSLPEHLSLCFSHNCLATSSPLVVNSTTYLV